MSRKPSQSDRVLEFFQQRPNQFKTFAEISHFFDDISPKSVSAVLSKMFIQGIIKRNGNTYGIGKDGWFYGQEPVQRKKSPRCETTKMLYSFPKDETRAGGRTDTCRLCIEQLQRNPLHQDLLADLLAAMPATSGAKHQKRLKQSQFK